MQRARADARLIRRSFVLRDQRVSLRVGAVPSMYTAWLEFLAVHPLSWSSLSICPSADLLVHGSWRYRFVASSSSAENATATSSAAAIATTTTTTTTDSATVVLSGVGDPGYNFTSAALAEAALCLAGRTANCVRASVGTNGGVYSPGALFDEKAYSAHLEQVGLLKVTMS